MIGVQNEDRVQRLRQHRVDLVLPTRHREAHAHEILGVSEIVHRIHERLSERIFVSHRRNGRHFRDQAVTCDFALMLVRDVGRVVIEGGKRADNANHDCHGMRVAPERPKQEADLLMHHRVIGDGVIEIRHLFGRRQLAVQQQVADFEKGRLLRELIDRIAAIEQNSLVAVYEGEVALA